MHELLAKALRGVDLSSPDAAWQIFHHLMAAMPWSFLLWFTAITMVIGIALGWWRGRIWAGIWMTALIGPISWIVLCALPSRRQQAHTNDDGPPPGQ